MNDQDQINEEERQEAATETPAYAEATADKPAFLGCPQHMPTHLPGGFDGTEPGEKSKYEVEVEELKKRGAKLKACNDRSKARLTEILSIAERVLIGTVHSDGYKPGQYGEDYRRFGKAFAEIRRLVKESIADIDPDYEMLALQFARNSFDFAKFQEALAAVASMKQVDFPGVYYTPGWLVELAKKLSGSEMIPPREKPIDPTAPEVVHPQRLDDIGMQMDKVVIVDDDGVICKIRRAGVLMMGIGRPAQLWEIDAMKHPTYCRVQVFCDHKPIFDGKAFGKNVHRAGRLGLAVMIRFIHAQRKHQRNCRAAAAAKKSAQEVK